MEQSQHEQKAPLQCEMQAEDKVAVGGEAVLAEVEVASAAMVGAALVALHIFCQLGGPLGN